MADPLVIVFGVFLALLFDFGNGFNDAANSVSTIVATRVLPPWKAVLLAAFLNFVAVFLFSTAVAQTIGKGIVFPAALNEWVILCGLLGAIFWVYLASFKGLPISASHALIGGLVGAALVAVGPAALVYSGLFTVVLFILAAPVIGFVAAFLFLAVVLRFAKRFPLQTVNHAFRKLQLLSVSVYSLGHGSNDAQKTMGIITALLFAGGFLSGKFEVPLWVIIASYTTIALGTLVGGWNVVHTMGFKIAKLKPIDGFCAESAGAGIILLCSAFGIPVSTTHVISGSIMGVGTVKHLKAVRWGVARRIVASWVLTLPIAAGVSALLYFLARLAGV